MACKILLLILLLNSVSTSFANDSVIPLTGNELRRKFGQDNTTYGDGRSCYRPCDGTRMTCYYEFQVENYDTMSGLCGDCENGVISDCFKPGCITANGVQRNIMSVNRRLPGTSINCCKDDRIIVDVTNHMAGSELAIHWHGLYQTETPWMDGVPMVTQCPIFSGNTFRYLFNARESGTHYYHAHSGVHRTNGIVGKFNVREQNDPNAEFYDFDLNEHAVLLSDWNNHLAEEAAPGTKSFINQPDSILINGFGTYYDKQHGNYTYAPIAAFYMQKGKKHRIRIDNAASFSCPFEFCIQGHRLTVISTDGYSVQPVTVDCVVTSAGERYDVVMDATNDSDKNETLMTVRGLARCRNSNIFEFARIILLEDFVDFKPTFEHHEPLRNRPTYESLDDPSKITINHPDTNCADPNEENFCVAALEQRQIKGVAGGDLRNETPEKVFPFKFTINVGDDRSGHYFTVATSAAVGLINNIASTGSPMPGLTQDDSEVQYCDSDNLPSNCNSKTICHCPHLVQLELCKVYEFFLYDGGRVGGLTSHPIHLHGYGFQVIDMGTYEQFLNGQTAFANAKKLPLVKDTIVLPSGGFVRLRFKSCNPGYWIFHCHFEYHMHVGMRATIKVGNRTDMVAPPAGFPTCGNYLPPIFETCSNQLKSYQ